MILSWLQTLMPFTSLTRLLVGGLALVAALFGLIKYGEHKGAAEQQLEQIKTDQKAVKKAGEARVKAARRPKKDEINDPYARRD